MGVRILTDKDEGYQCFYCSTTMWAFGPIFYEEEDVTEFLVWLKVDPRRLKDKELEDKTDEWRRIREKEEV